MLLFQILNLETRAKFTLAKARYVMQKKNSDLAKHWDTYFNDLIAICKPRTATSIHTISFGEFLRRYEKMMIEASCLLAWRSIIQ